MANRYTDFFDAKGPNVKLYEDLINETVSFFGIECYYMVRESLSIFDSLLGDDPAKMFKQAYPVTVYVQTVDQFEGFEAISKFGLEVRKQARFLVPTRLFNARMPDGFGRPREGDILWLPNFKAFFELKKADEEHIFYTFGDQDIYAFSLVCEKWNYDQATVNTGITAIDSTIDSIVISYTLTVNPAGNGTFTLGEKVTGNNTSATATVTTWNKPTGNLTVKSITGTFILGENITGQNSNAVFNVTNINIRDSVTDQLDDNQDVATEADTILIFDPSNPFGDPQQ
jgi:hypothetical protein